MYIYRERKGESAGAGKQQGARWLACVGWSRARRVKHTLRFAKTYDTSWLPVVLVTHRGTFR